MDAASSLSGLTFGRCQCCETIFSVLCDAMNSPFSFFLLNGHSHTFYWKGLVRKFEYWWRSHPIQIPECSPAGVCQCLSTDTINIPAYWTLGIPPCNAFAVFSIVMWPNDCAVPIIVMWPEIVHFHWVGKIQKNWITGWAMVATGWTITHLVNMLAEALVCMHLSQDSVGVPIYIKIERVWVQYKNAIFCSIWCSLP